MNSANSSSPMVSVYSGRTCLGFVFCRGPAGYEAFDRKQRSIGFFRSQREAAAAIPEIEDERR